MEKTFRQIKRKLEEDIDVILVTIIAGKGSVPRGAGARMWLSRDGEMSGTIGGGNVEYQAAIKARELLERKRSFMTGYNLGQADIADMGMVCGGQVQGLFQYLCKKDIPCMEAVIAQCGKAQDAWLLLHVTDADTWDMRVMTKEEAAGHKEYEEIVESMKNKPAYLETGSGNYYIESLVESGIVYVFGGGHVAQELVPLLSHLGFPCFVTDDRKEFASKERFPDAVETLVCDYDELEEHIHIKSCDYVVIMTRGHQHDYEVQTQLLKYHPFYMGIMGSRNKIAYVSGRLLNDGYTKEEIGKCHMPIGTAIKAETPAEIAVSIAGELICKRAAGKLSG